MSKKRKLACGEIYHIYNRSIAEFIIFNDESEYIRMVNLISYYRFDNTMGYAACAQMNQRQSHVVVNSEHQQKKPLNLIAYCIMPTHIHLVVEQLEKGGITNFMGVIQNSYSRFFNTKHKRKGPLWEGRFKDAIVKTNAQLLHLSRYVHLNPTTAYLVNKPEEWFASSYAEYIGKKRSKSNICDPHGLIDMKPAEYRKFVEEGIAYQREFAVIKKLAVDSI